MDCLFQAGAKGLRRKASRAVARAAIRRVLTAGRYFSLETEDYPNINHHSIKYPPIDPTRRDALHIAGLLALPADDGGGSYEGMRVPLAGILKAAPLSCLLCYLCGQH